MNAAIGFENFVVSCIIGIDEEERSLEQDLLIDVKIFADASKCIESDDIQDAIDYSEVAVLIESLAQENGYYLLETLGADFLKEVKKRWAIHKAWVKIKKPKAFKNTHLSFIEMEIQ